jgi:hypothetical protein
LLSDPRIQVALLLQPSALKHAIVLLMGNSLLASIRFPVLDRGQGAVRLSAVLLVRIIADVRLAPPNTDVLGRIPIRQTTGLPRDVITMSSFAASRSNSEVLFFSSRTCAVFIPVATSVAKSDYAGRLPNSQSHPHPLDPRSACLVRQPPTPRCSQGARPPRRSAEKTKPLIDRLIISNAQKYEHENYNHFTKLRE